MSSLFRLFLLLCLCTGGALQAVALEPPETECESSDDCPDGTECMPTPCPAIACDPDDEDCEPLECPSYCASLEDSIPDVLTCTADEDCPLYFSCDEVELPCPSNPTSVGCPPCACPDCPPGEECEPCDCPPCEEPEPVEEEECTPEILQLCRFQEVDCLEDATICAAGFQCQEMEACEVSGSGGSTGTPTDCLCPTCEPGEECPPCECDEDEGGSDPVDPIEPPDETCQVTGAICVPEEVECAEDADCLEDWECVAVPSDEVAVSCVCATCPPCEPCAEGEECEECPECPPCDCDDQEPVEEEGKSVCLPGGWAELINSGWAGEDEVLVQNGNNTGGPSDTNPEDPGLDPGNSENAGNKSESSGGCTASARSQADVFLSLVLVLAGAVLLRRRFTYQA